MAQKIAIIGNGDVDAALAEEIDAADLVIRFNDCRSCATGGSRTDIVAVCNTGRPGKMMTEGEGWKANPAIMRASAIWLVRDGGMYAHMRAPLRQTHPELDDFCDDYSEEFRIFANATGKELHVVPQATHEGVDAELKQFDPEPYVVPSSGLVVISEVLRNTRSSHPDIVLAGFGHVGWSGHPFPAERRLVDDLVRRGSVRRLSADATPLPFQGA